MVIQRRTRSAKALPWGIGQSLPIGYGALSFIAPRRRRGMLWIWAVAAILAIAAGGAAWMWP